MGACLECWRLRDHALTRPRERAFGKDFGAIPRPLAIGDQDAPQVARAAPFSVFAPLDGDAENVGGHGSRPIPSI